MRRQLRGDHNQCPTCGEYFNSGAAFEKHRIGKHGVDRRCMSPWDMDFAGMALNRAGYWISARSDGDWRPNRDAPRDDRQSGGIYLAKHAENGATPI